MKPLLTLVDGMSFVHRAYHAVPPRVTVNGIPTNALFGYIRMLLGVLRSDPTHVAVVFDVPGPTFRNTLSPIYKQNRPAKPDDLIAQFPLVKLATEVFSIPTFSVPGVEADDVLATLTTKALSEGFQVRLVSQDKDLMQLVSPDVHLFDSMKTTKVHDVLNKLGIDPAQVVDFLALMGDDADNVIGLDGVGPKTAASLLQHFNTLENLIAHTDLIAKPKIRTQVEANVDRLRLNRKLTALRKDVELPSLSSVRELHRRPINLVVVGTYLTEMEMGNLQYDIPTYLPDPIPEPSPPSSQPVAEKIEQSLTIEESPLNRDRQPNAAPNAVKPSMNARKNVMDLIPAGNYNAKALSASLSQTSKGDPQLEIRCEITEGDLAGSNITYFGYFSEKALPITFKAMRTAGWQGDNVEDLTSINGGEISIAVIQDTYNGKTKNKIAWINPKRASPLDASKAKTFADQMREKLRALEGNSKPVAPSASAATPSAPAGNTIDDLPF